MNVNKDHLYSAIGIAGFIIGGIIAHGNAIEGAQRVEEFAGKLSKKDKTPSPPTAAE